MGVYDYRPDAGHPPVAQTQRGLLLEKCLPEYVRDRSWRFLDVGGASGALADFLLDKYPNAEGVVIDISKELLNRNAENDRKQCQQLSAEHIADHFKPHSFDVIILHTLLHHLVTGDYESSDNMVRTVMGQCATLLAPNGRVSVVERVYEGRVFAESTSHIIFRLTSSKHLCRLCKRLGAHTAGVGVRFLPLRQWKTLFRETGYTILRCDVGQQLKPKWYIRWPLLIAEDYHAHFWLSIPDRNGCRHDRFSFRNVVQCVCGKDDERLSERV
ncbi:MAG: class I SAM-dependent methyltransferase [Phycisphaerales bacterium]|nr:MAG: class I SAM-dependent methyltransferase [Phycisphaerales bacterium]